MKLTHVVALVVAGALVAGGCGDSEEESAGGTGAPTATTTAAGGSSDRTPADRIGAAMARTEKAGAFRMESTMTISEQGERLEVTSTIDAALDGSRSHGKLRYEPASGKPYAMESITVDGAMYLKGPQFAAALPPGKEWLKTPHTNDTLSPTAFVEVLQDTGDLEEVGREEQGGVRAVHVRAPFDLKKVAAKQPDGDFAQMLERQPELADRMKGTIDVWIGEADDRLLRMDMAMRLDGKEMLAMRGDIVAEGVSLAKAKAPDASLVAEQRTESATPNR